MISGKNNLLPFKHSGNRWNCDCNLVTFLPKLLLEGQIRTEVLCSEPEEVRDQNILVVTKVFYVLEREFEFFFLKLN